MAGLIKSQILKHLSKFAKNLNAESINVSTLRGEGELKNLELNEQVLTDLLELPTWLRLTRASVNRVSIKIQWTKLKSVPIHLSLDEVVVAMETCEQLRPHTASSATPSHTSGSHYGFADKVVDGLTVTINSVHLTFRSAVFSAVCQMSRVVLDSRSPGWQRVVDLRMTRLKDPERGFLLLFKELSWQSLRVEATSNTADQQQQQLAPLRLLTNASHCRLTIKKRLADCGVVGCRLVLLLDDLLWVLTDSQLLTACHFAQSLAELVRQATQISHKIKAVRKLESLPDFYGQQQQQSSKPGVAGLSVFSKFDVIETSYHLVCERIDLHLCDDPGSGRSSHPHLTAGASLQLALTHLRVDYYPYHLAAGDRSHWVKYNDCGPQQVSQNSLSHFRGLLVDALSGSRAPHTPLARAPPLPTDPQHHPAAPPSCGDSSTGGRGAAAGGGGGGGSQQLKALVATQMRKLMSSVCVVSVKDFVLYRVTTSKRRHTPKEFISSDKERLCLPTTTSCVHLEFISYYYPGDCDFPVPAPGVYGCVCPVLVTLDLLSVLWLNAFGRALQLAVLPDPASSPPQYLDLHVQFIMPRVVLEAAAGGHQQKDRPSGLQVQASRVTLSNCRPPDPSVPGSLAALGATLEAAQTTGQLFFASEFPARSEDLLAVSCKFVRHAMGEDNIRQPPRCAPSASVYEAMSSLSRESLWSEARDLLFLHCEPVWVEFTGTPAFRHRPLPFVDAFPLSVWIHLKMPGIKDGVPIQPGVVDEYSPVRSVADLPGVGVVPPSASAEASVSSASTRVKREKSVGKKEAGLNVLVHCHSLISCQINHFQLLFLMRQLDMLTELSAFLTSDSRVIYDKAAEHKAWVRSIEDSLVISAIVPQVDLTFVIPPLHPTKDSMLDMEGFVPDSSSTVGEELDSLREMRGSTSDHSLSLKVGAGCAQGGVCEPELAKSQSDSHLASTRTVSAAPCGDEVVQVCPGLQRQPPLVNLVSPSTPSAPATNGATNSLQDNLNIGFSSMKKGFSSLMTSIETSVKTSPEEMSDTISIQSDLSSDSENFVLLNLENSHHLGGAAERSDSGLGLEAAFRSADRASGNGGPVEVAAEALEETTPSEDLSEITTSFRRKGNVALVNVQLSGLQFVQEARGFDSVIKLEAQGLHMMDCNAVPYEEFQSKFSSRSKGWHDCFPPDHLCTFRIRLDTRVDSEAAAGRGAPRARAPDGSTARPEGSSQGNVPSADGPSGGASKLFSRPRIGPFSLANSPLKKSLDHFDEADALNLWKKCTSYSPKISHIFPKWTRRSSHEPQEAGDALRPHPQQEINGSAPAASASATVPSSPAAVPATASTAAAAAEDKRYSVPQLPVQVVQELHAAIGDLSVDLLLSSLSGLADLVQDELPPQPLACSVELWNLEAVVREDRGSVHIGSEEGTTRLLVPELLVQRDAEGTFLLLPRGGRRPGEPPQPAAAPAGAGEAADLAAEVARLREALKASTGQLRATQDENLSLREAIRMLRLDTDALHRQQTPVPSTGGESSAKVDLRQPDAAARAAEGGPGKPLPGGPEAAAVKPSKGIMSGMKLGSPGGLSRFGSLSSRKSFLSRDARAKSQPPS